MDMGERLAPDPSGDQHLMADAESARMIVDAAEIAPSDSVLEIGGGLGALSSELAKRPGKLTILEKDDRYFQALRRRFSSSRNVSVIHGDILHAPLPEFNKVVSNPPYSIIEGILLRLVREAAPSMTLLVMTLPYRATLSLSAKPGSPYFNSLSLLSRAFFEVSVLFKIGPEKFNPPPRVSSFAVRIAMRRLGSGRAAIAQLLLQGLFLYPEKKLSNILRDILWNYGGNFLGKRESKKGAALLALRIIPNLKEFGGKPVSALSRKELAELLSAVDGWLAEEGAE